MLSSIHRNRNSDTKSDTAYSIACRKYYNLSTSTKAAVEKALTGRDTSDLRASFRRALSFSIPPLTLYRNYSPPGAYSELIFGVPLVDLETTQDNVPKVMRLCIEEVDKRGLKSKRIYSVSFSCQWPDLVFMFSVTGRLSIRRRSTTGQWNPSPWPVYQLTCICIQLRRRFESEKSFSFNSTDNIYSIAMLLQVSPCDRCERVSSLHSPPIHLLALPLGTSRAFVYAFFARLWNLQTR